MSTVIAIVLLLLCGWGVFLVVDMFRGDHDQWRRKSDEKKNGHQRSNSPEGISQVEVEALRLQAASAEKTIAEAQGRVEHAYAFLRRAACYNQGAYTQYMYFLTEWHRLMRRELREGISNKEGRKYFGKLMDSVNAEVRSFDGMLSDVVHENFDLLHTHFRETRSDKPDPRICVKFHFEEVEEHLAAVFRDVKEPYNPQYRSSDSTAFRHVLSTGASFMQNNIPEAIALHGFTNPRINTDDARAWYLQNRTELETGASSPSLDRTWQECWLQGGSPKSYYKSTLIVPITFWNNRLTERFVELIDQKLPNFQSTIFGFLCFDSTEIGYFNSDSDLASAYAVADYLSLFLLARILYVQKSSAIELIRVESGRDGGKYIDEDMHGAKRSDLEKGIEQFRGNRDAKKDEMEVKKKHRYDKALMDNLVEAEEPA